MLAVELSRDFLLTSALRLHLLKVLALSEFLPFRAYFGVEYFGELFLSKTILLVVELVLVQIQQIRIVRPVMPIFAFSFVVFVHRRTYLEIRHEVLASPGLILPD